jgi:pimeloyl-ACP methyl ester carboxylesterase
MTSKSSLPASTVIQIDGQAIQYLRAGSGAPSVVLVNGAGGPLEGWFRMLPSLLGDATLLAYNRPGIGKSSKPDAPQTGLHMLGQLRALLKTLDLPQPYVLVGHSLGGLLVNLFARHYPGEVAAVVMLEASAPEDIAAMARHESGVQRLLRRALDRLLPPDPNGEAAQVAATISQLNDAPAFPPLPLTVVSGGRPAMAWATPAEALRARAANQRALAGLSPLGRQVIAERSGHFPQLTEPELVVRVIREAISAATPAQVGQAAGAEAAR